MEAFETWEYKATVTAPVTGGQTSGVRGRGVGIDSVGGLC